MGSPQAGHLREATRRATAATTDGTFEVATPISDSASDDRWVFRIGGWAAIAGAVLGLVGNLIHPVTAGPADPAATARVVAESQIWVPVHLALIVAFILMLGGLIAIRDSINGGLAGALARFGMSAAIIGTAGAVILLSLDGFAAKHLAKSWLSAPADARATALAAFSAEDSINFALLSPLNLVFAGVTFVLYGLAAAFSSVYPRWLGWVAVAGGAGGAVSGVIQASIGEPSSITQALGIAAPTIITLWLLVVGILLVRMGMGHTHTDVLVERSFMVPVPTANAWSALADVAAWPSWAPHIMGARVSPPGPVRADAVGTFRFRPVGRSRFTMTEFDPPRSWTWTGRAIGVTIDYQHRFETVSPETTRLVWVVRSRSRAGVRARLFALVYSRLRGSARP